MGLCTLVSAGFSSYITVGRKFRDLYGTFEAFGWSFCSQKRRQRLLAMRPTVGLLFGRRLTSLLTTVPPLWPVNQRLTDCTAAGRGLSSICARSHTGLARGVHGRSGLVRCDSVVLWLGGGRTCPSDKWPLVVRSRQVHVAAATPGVSHSSPAGRLDSRRHGIAPRVLAATTTLRIGYTYQILQITIWIKIQLKLLAFLPCVVWLFVCVFDVCVCCYVCTVPFIIFVNCWLFRDIKMNINIRDRSALYMHYEI